MPGKKLDVVQTEDVLITDDGRGLKFYNDGTNVLIARAWDGPYYQSGTQDAGATNRRTKILCAGSSSGWLKITMVSGNNADETFYIPVFSNVNTKLST